MTRALICFAVFVCSSRGLAEQKSGAPLDHFDLVFIPPPADSDAMEKSAKRPYLLRIYVQSGTVSVSERFRTHLKKWFDLVDVNKDAKLDAKEVILAPKAWVLAEILRDGTLSKDQTLTMADLKKRPDESATFEDFLAYYDRNNVRAYQITPTFREGDPASDALFKMLDADGDGKLSRAEVSAAPDLLGKYDADDDEMISPEELLPSLSRAPGRAAMNAMTKPQPARRAAPAFGRSFYSLVSPAERAVFPEILLAHFDTDDSGTLSAKECAFARQTFALLDKNKDGELALEELAEWIKGPADFEFVIQFSGEDSYALKGLSKNQPRLAEITLTPKTVAADLKDSLHQVGRHVSFMALGNCQIMLQGRALREESNPFTEPRFRLLQLFEASERDDRGYVELADVESEVAGMPSLKKLFTIADRDRDGKLTRAELAAFADLIEEMPRCQAALAVIDRGRALFPLLDANRDGRLSLHELRNAWRRLEVFDMEKKGTVSQEQITQQFDLVVMQAPSQKLTNALVRAPGYHDGQGLRTLGPENAPLWFRKMDVNGDGFVSRREFLGGRADFQRIDANGDGLIDPEEASRYDALSRSNLLNSKKE